MKKVLAMVLMVTMMVACFCSCVVNKAATAQVIDINLTDENYAFGVDKNQPELLAAANELIAEMKKDDSLEDLCNKYFSDGTPTPITSAKLDPSKDQLLVATNAAFEPFEYTDGDKYLGIDMEIAAMLAEKLGQELVIQNMDFDAVCLTVGQQKCDIAMAGLTISEDRKEFVNFSDSYYAASQKLIVKEGDTTFAECKTAADVEAVLKSLPKDTKIGVQQGTTGQLYVEGDADWGFEGYDVKCVSYKNGSLAVQDMLNGNIDYVIIDAAPAECIVEAINEVK